jgi:hypoxanthine-guanine phosphoribosyltransferase
MLRVLRDCLCRQIPLDKDLEDVSAILFLEDVVHTGFKLRERYEAVEDTQTNSVSGFVVIRVHG